MTIEEFAKSCGVTISYCDKEYGGEFAYQLKDHPNCMYCGYKSAASAYKNWLVDTFGNITAKGLIKLLKDSEVKT